ncbi:ABC transporter ATP-binding protein [Clostridium estertheticum]|uniref:ABC transporter ATP-binding protein n=1 Tax=Clostridium estertheticum TaxID=238834 RepID=UPI0013EE5B79|nr:ABC transporter ATP-binding protein [Clostridium estertheticum]MBZ9609944.1 ABC transporter ATP-binding protein [Clostridium estertheticum]
MSLLKIEHLDFKYSNEKVLFNDANLKLNKGEITCLIGANGSGKTTLLKILSNIISTDLNIEFLDQNKTTIKDNIKHIGYVPDKPFLYDYLTGKENIDYITNVFKENKSIIKDKILEICKRLNLYDNLNEEVRNYSLGMKHKLFLAIILSRNVDLILMDEPLTSLDTDSTKIIMKIMNDLCKDGATILLSSHIKQIVDNLADRILCVKNYKIVECEKADKEIFNEEKIS